MVFKIDMKLIVLSLIKRGTLQQLNVFIRDREERVGKIVGGIYFLSLFESYNA